MVLSPPVIVRELSHEFWILQDDTPVRSSPPTETRYSTIKVTTRCDLDVSDRETKRSERFPHRELPRDAEWRDYLRGADPSNREIFEAGEYEREESRRPHGIVVRKDLFRD